jgi:hypothetical protein
VRQLFSMANFGGSLNVANSIWPTQRQILVLNSIIACCKSLHITLHHRLFCFVVVRVFHPSVSSTVYFCRCIRV